MTKKGNRIVSVLLLLAMVFTVLAGTFSVSADTYTGATPLDALINKLVMGKVTTNNGTVDYTTHSYKLSGGGTVLYPSLWVNGASSSSSNLFTAEFENLTAGAKQDFLKDVLGLSNAIVDDVTYMEQHNNYSAANLPSAETVTDLTRMMQNQSGMAGQLLASLLQNTKPDYVTANRLYAPFSGIVGTILGIVSILIMALLGVTMALDLAYITIPAFQMALGGTDNTNGNGEKGKGIGGIISQEAKKAVQAADGGSSGQSGSGEYRAAVGIYFKYRWKGLVLLGICLLYLVQGQIYSFVGWFIDLFSGFLGF